MPEKQNDMMFGSAWAVRLSIGLLAGLTLVTLFSIHDRRQRAALEQVTAPTAVGDTHFVPKPADAASPIANFRGQPLFLIEPAKGRDSEMLRIGNDDSGNFSVYRSTRKGVENPDRLLLKTAPGNYLGVEPHQ